MTPATAFNLLDEPWIPVRTLDGDVREVNLTDALLHAGDHAALAEPSPPNLVALHRLLLAVLHRALTTQHGKWTDRDRARWFRDGLPRAPIRAYLEQWRDRFWLFHPTQPFMQVAALAEAEETRGEDARRPWTQLTLDYVSGNAPAVFEHCIDSRPLPIAPAAVLRHLIGYLQFVPGGMIRRFRFRDESGALDNVAAVLPVGASLHQTLCLSLAGSVRGDVDDLPPWEVDPVSVAMLREYSATLPTGEVDLFTRLSRAVLLMPEGETSALAVRWIRFGAGLTMRIHDQYSIDPMAAYRKRAGDRIYPVTFQDGRAVWRDLPAILPFGNDAFHPPAVLDRALNCVEDVNTELRFMIAGTASDPVQCKVFRWRIEHWTIPSLVVAHPDAARYLRAQIDAAESLFGDVRRLLSDLVAKTMPDPEHKDTRARARSIVANGPAAATFFSSAERALPRLMKQIAAGDIDAADRDWKATLLDAAHQSWAAVRRTLGDTPAALRADALTWPRFCGLLKPLVQPAAQTALTMEEISA